MTNEEKRALSVRLMISRKGRNTYTNGSKRQYFFGYPQEGQDGYSDCSSAVREAIRRAAKIYIGSNTDAQIRNYKKGILVENTSNSYPDESKLKPGDCLYFKGNRNHVKQVGHVEMYTGPNECWGHGSGKGPTKKNLRKYCQQRAAKGKRYFCAIRWIPDDEEPVAPTAPEKPKDEVEYKTVSNGRWNVRARATTNSSKVGLVREGDELRFYGEKDGFYGVKGDGVKGYVHKDAFK